MAVTAADLKIRYSMGNTGAAGTFDPAGSTQSIGGTMANNAIDEGTLLANLYDVVTGRQSSMDRTITYKDYRVVYVRNGAGTTAFATEVYFPTEGNPAYPVNYWGEAPSSGYTAGTDIGFCWLGVSTARDIAAPVLADETTAPSGVSWSQPTPSATLAIGDLPASSYRALYIQRIIPIGASAYDQANFNITIGADTGQ